MQTKLLTFLCLILSITIFSQEYIFGKVSSDMGTELPETMIVNMRTDEKIRADKDGNYMIAAKLNDELRFVKNGYDRNITKIAAENYSKSLNIILEKSPFQIEEIELAFHPTGNLKKDSKALDIPLKVVALNNDMKLYMMRPPTEMAPKLSTPSAFAPRNMNAGQVNIFGLASAISGLLRKATKDPLTKANYAETQAFFREIKNSLDLSFYTKQGWDEEEIDRFLIYADENYSLAKKYRKTFDVAAIKFDMRMAYQEYVKTHKIGF